MIFDGDRDKLADYVWSLATAMKLGDWRIKLADSPPPSPPSGDAPGGFCNVIYGRKYAVIQLADDWASWPDWELRETVTHELVHCHTVQMQWAFNNITHSVSQNVYDTLHGAWTDALEISIDGIAVAWARTLPLPVTAKKKRKEAKVA